MDQAMIPSPPAFLRSLLQSFYLKSNRFTPGAPLKHVKADSCLSPEYCFLNAELHG